MTRSHVVLGFICKQPNLYFSLPAVVHPRGRHHWPIVLAASCARLAPFGPAQPGAGTAFALLRAPGEVPFVLKQGPVQSSEDARLFRVGRSIFL